MAETIHKKMTEKQELFCTLYATDREFFGNGTQAYIEAYDPDKSSPNWYRGCQVSASRLLSNPIICQRINELLEECGFNDVSVDKQLAFLLTQHEDFKTKLGAIKEYNKLKQRITERSEVAVTGLTVVIEDSYGTNPNFRQSNQISQTDDLAEDSSTTSSEI